MKTNEPARFSLMDFSNYSDSTSCALFNVRKREAFSPIPIDRRHTAFDICDFCRMGKNQRDNFRTPPTSTQHIMEEYPCYGIDIALCKSESLSWKSVIVDGFKNLIRQAMRSRADLLRENVLPDYHFQTGIVINKQGKSKPVFILRERC